MGRSITLSLSQKSLRGTKGTTRLVMKDSNLGNFEVVCAKEQHSTSILDLATIGCFLKLRDTSLGPKKMQDSEVGVRSSESLI